MAQRGCVECVKQSVLHHRRIMSSPRARQPCTAEELYSICPILTVVDCRRKLDLKATRTEYLPT
jgi:hypothetical protein